MWGGITAEEELLLRWLWLAISQFGRWDDSYMGGVLSSVYVLTCAQDGPVSWSRWLLLHPSRAWVLGRKGVGLIVIDDA